MVNTEANGSPEQLNTFYNTRVTYKRDDSRWFWVRRRLGFHARITSLNLWKETKKSEKVTRLLVWHLCLKKRSYKKSAIHLDGCRIEPAYKHFISSNAKNQWILYKNNCPFKSIYLSELAFLFMEFRYLYVTWIDCP